MTEITKKWLKSIDNLKFEPFPVANDSVGIFNGLSVQVFDENHIKSLHKHSFYGKGSLSRSLPICLNEKIKKNLENSSGSSQIAQRKQLQEDSDFKRQKTENNSYNLKESLDLFLEEAFFLNHQIKCLTIVDLTKKALSAEELWMKFCDIKYNFAQCYIAYLYMKSRNWVIKPGIKFGGDFLLYNKNPLAYHAAYVVIVRKAGEKTKTDCFKSLHRIAETTGKELVYIDVNFPENVDHNDFLSCYRNLDKFSALEITQARFNIMDQK